MEPTSQTAGGTIREYFEADHDRLEQLFLRFQELKRIEFGKAKPFFREFKFGLVRHIIWEEEILFPVFEQQTGMTQSGPTAVMRAEHAIIKERLEILHDFVRNSDPDSDDAERHLMEALAVHNEKEERVLYPALDSMTDEDARKAIFSAMEAIPEDRYRICCGHHIS